MPDSRLNPSARSLCALDYLNVFLADVRDGMGPYLAIYLLATHHWDAGNIGAVLSVMGIATVLAQTPAGALIDKTRHKRLLIGLGAVFVAAACITMTIFPNFYAIATAQAFAGVAAAIFPPAVAAITLGMVGHRKLAARIGRNEGFNHAGNVGAAVLAGLIGHYIAREGIFYLVAAMALASLVSVYSIRPEEIDHRVARGAKTSASDKEEISGFSAIVKDRRIVLFALAIALFHFANAAMLPLVGEMLSAGKARGASLYMSACIIVAQLVMIPVALWAGKHSETWGRKPIFLIGFAVLPIRGVLYTLTDHPAILIAIQALDGIGAGIFGVLWVLVVADLTQGTGRYNITQGAVATAVAIGAALSNIVAGYIVAAGGYHAGFLSLAAIAALALVIYYFSVPETKDFGEGKPAPPATAAAVPAT